MVHVSRYMQHKSLLMLTKLHDSLPQETENSYVYAGEARAASAALPLSDGTSGELRSQAVNNGFQSRLPSMTTDTEPWSTDGALLHAREDRAVANEMPSRKADVALPAPASPDFSLSHQEMAAEPTFSLSSTDVSPDKSITSTV